MSMNHITKYAVIVLALAVSCQGVATQEVSKQVVASVAESKLYADEVISAIPSGSSGDDSVAFVKLYAKRWIERQTKLREAKRIFSSSVDEVEKMVEEYRQSLLTRRLDQYYINASQESPFTDEDIESYYKANSSNLKLDAAIVRGRILRIPRNYARESKLLEMMKSSSESSRQDLISTSEKQVDCLLEDFGSSWVDYNDFVARLPIVRDKNYFSYIYKKGVQTLRDDNYTYYFDIASYRKSGDTAPLELAQESIKRILTNQHHQEIIRKVDEELYRKTIEEGVIHNYTVGITAESSDY